jgi:hypothetical protein
VRSKEKKLPRVVSCAVDNIDSIFKMECLVII